MLTAFCHLKEKKKEPKKDLKEVKEKINDIDLYINYFTYLTQGENLNNFYKIQKDTRYILSVPCIYKEPLTQMEIRLAEAKSRSEYTNSRFLRQYGYKVNFNSMLKGEFYPTEYFIYFRQKPELDKKLFSILPAGEYLCFQTQALEENWDINLLSEYFKNKPKPKLVLALEFKDNLVEYYKAQYEIQILI